MKIAIGITGASGAIYAKKLIDALKENHNLYVVASNLAVKIFSSETNINMDKFLNHPNITTFKNNNLNAPISSGSFLIDACIVVPCSMKTLSAIANGFADTLISRCADVTLKERRKLILIPRETPLSLIHIENMLKITKAGGIILPPSPAFYFGPSSIEDIVNFIVGRILDLIGIKHSLFKRWQ